MDHLPVFLRLQGRRALVVGGGAVAARKAELLLRCGAAVTFVAPELTGPAQQLLAADQARGRLQHLATSFSAEHLEGVAIVIAATDASLTNAAVAAAAHARALPVNVVDDAERSSFIMPAIIDRSPLVVAVGSQGAAPVLVRRIREQLEALLPERLGALARFAGRRRRDVQQALKPAQRRQFWEGIFAGRVSARVLDGDEAGAAAAFTAELGEFRAARAALGQVYLVGAGPGDPDLLTLRALQVLQQADVILYDRLVSAAVLERARRDALRLFVGKDAGTSSTPQERIHALAIDHARRGLTVVRLKGGDPFIFGRGGEEIQALSSAGIPVTVVPGITAGLAAAAAAGIALTHRKLAHSVTFVAGQFAGADALDWSALARPRHTVVFYMGVAQLEGIAAALLAAGAPATRPAAIIERASLPEQRIVRAGLAEIATRARAARIGAPALLIVGEVAAAAGDTELESLTAVLRGVA